MIASLSLPSLKQAETLHVLLTFVRTEKQVFEIRRRTRLVGLLNIDMVLRINRDKGKSFLAAPSPRIAELDKRPCQEDGSLAANHLRTFHDHRLLPDIKRIAPSTFTCLATSKKKRGGGSFGRKPPTNGHIPCDRAQKRGKHVVRGHQKRGNE